MAEEPKRVADTAALRTRLLDMGVKKGYELRFVIGLIREQILTYPDVASFIAQARQAEEDLAVYAVTSGLMTDERLLQMVADFYNYTPVRLAEAHVEEQTAMLISIEQARAWNAMPYGRNDVGDILVAVSDPANVKAQDELPQHLVAEGAIASREAIEWRLASPLELNSYIDRIYRAASLLESVRSASEEEEEAETMVVRSEAIDSRVIKVVDDLILKAAIDGASDIHIAPRAKNTSVRMRLDGQLREVMTLPVKMTPQVVARIKNLANMKTDERRDAQDGRVTYSVGGHQVDLRVVTLPVQAQGHGTNPERVVMRVLDSARAMLTLSDLGMEDDNLQRYEEAIKKPYGMALITGPTGSGKSTTLYASMNSNFDPALSLASIEDPVEYQLEGIDQTSVAGNSKLNFAKALRALMRADPDIIMVGEIRDPETAKTAVDAALTGHFLYSTLHTNEAVDSIIRLRELGVDPFLLASTLEVVVSQRLIRLLCPDCKEPLRADAATLRQHRAPDGYIALAERDGGLDIATAHPGGCARCNETGYRGRSGVHEVLTFTEEMRKGILEGRAVEEIEAMARAANMHSLRDDAFRRVVRKQTSLEEFAKKVV